ncbi:hypothetical protein AB5I41_09810 [Sphingomonas sp. MMS24-JH45]
MEPLREDWLGARTAAMEAAEGGDRETARKLVEAFHTKLAQTKVLDPACGTGNSSMSRWRGWNWKARCWSCWRNWATPGTSPNSADILRAGELPRHRDQPARGGDRAAGAVDRILAVAFPRERRGTDASRRCFAT